MKYKPLAIGSLRLDVPVMLAPMAGYTDAPFRALCRRFGASFTFTEVTMASGIARRIPQAMYYFETVPGERPVAAHMYGADPGEMAEAAAIAEDMGRFDTIDINCGCPVRKIQKKGAGVALLHTPQRIGQIVEAVRARVDLPVTVKTRIGLTPESENISEVAQIVEEAGAEALIIHARFASARHGGPPDLEILRRIKAERTLPVIGNGGVRTVEEANHMMDFTGVDGLMIARGAIGSPWFFEAIHADWTGGDFTPPDPEIQCDIIEDHLRALYGHVKREDSYRRKHHISPEQVTCLRFRAHLARYASGYPGWRDLMRTFNQLTSVDEAVGAIRRLVLAGD